RRTVRRAGDTVPRPPSRATRREVRHVTAPRAGTRRVRRMLGALGAVGLAVVLTAVVVQVRLPADAVDRAATASSTRVPAAAAPTTAPTAAPTTAPADRPTAAPTSPDPTRDRADPAAAAAELTRRRAVLLSGVADGAASPVGLADVDVPGSPAHDADAALLDDVRQAGTRVRGAAVHVDGARTQEHDDEEADVVVRYAIGAHEQVAADGAVTAVPATDARTATLRLAWTPDGWRVAEVA
ncbi:hypothetical protein, partial [Isoptericola sp. NPDC057559]|uniref:hypothetical protein n=1 Tax=Isoptericola sp. NPDC057559 TaxID=3346168 RepID=UPI0036B398A6